MVANKYKVAVNFIQCEKLRMYRVADTNKRVSRFKDSVFGSMSWQKDVELGMIPLFQFRG